jgi:anti-sigma B factor antagonist
MRVECEQIGAECRVSLSGRITIDSSPDLRDDLLGRLETPNCSVLTLDLHDVSYIDTSGLAILVEILRAACTRGKAFRLTRLGERPRYLLETTRLLHLFENETPTSPR